VNPKSLVCLSLGLWVGVVLAGDPERVAASYRCELVDGQLRHLGHDPSLRFPASVRSCTLIARLQHPAVRGAGRETEAPAQQTELRVIVAPRDASHLKAAAPPSKAPEWVGNLSEAARRHGVAPELVQAVIQVESGYRADARSSKGAMGLMQLMPATAARFGVPTADSLLDPAVNIEAGTRYLRWLSDRFGARLELVLAAYNAGEGAVVRHGHQVPPYPETRTYVDKVLRLLPTPP
jgi:soluble lytic murein transglycosylase-like protein